MIAGHTGKAASWRYTNHFVVTDVDYPGREPVGGASETRSGR